MTDPRAESFADYLDWLSASWSLFEHVRARQTQRPTAPGRALQMHLSEQGMSQSELARRLRCTHAKVNEVIHGKRSITPKFALELERVLELPASYWMSVQTEFDLWRLRRLGF